MKKQGLYGIVIGCTRLMFFIDVKSNVVSKIQFVQISLFFYGLLAFLSVKGQCNHTLYIKFDASDSLCVRSAPNASDFRFIYQIGGAREDYEIDKSYTMKYYKKIPFWIHAKSRVELFHALSSAAEKAIKHHKNGRDTNLDFNCIEGYYNKVIIFEKTDKGWSKYRVGVVDIFDD